MQLDDDADGNVIVQKRYHTGDDLQLMHSENTDDGKFIATGFTRKDVTGELHDAVLKPLVLMIKTTRATESLLKPMEDFP